MSGQLPSAETSLGVAGTSACATFELYVQRFEFTAGDAIYFPVGKPGNVLRGAFGTVFRRIASEAVYTRNFEPVGSEGPSGFADRPRPYVFRARHLDGARIEPGERFHFDMHLFDTREPAFAEFRETFAEIGREGIGPGRGRAQLESAAGEPERVSVDLVPKAHAKSARVEFLTPTELKDRDRIAARPDFGVLFARVRDRVSTLRALYGTGPLDVDFKLMGERAGKIRMTGCEVRHVGVERRSSRTGQVHPLGGFTGWANYEGDIGEFLPYLEAARWTGVGRQTVWGKGEIAVSAG